MQAPTTAHYRLADQLLEGDLAEFICSRRASGVAPERIARELWAATDGEIDVTGHTVRKWAKRLGCNDAEAVA